MNPIDLLFRLRNLDIRLWAEDDQLRVSAPKGGITDDLLAEIKRNKEELLTRIQGSTRFSRAVSLSPIERSDSLQLSFAQQRLWFVALQPVGFLLFRVFDIAKPFPSGRAQSWPRGWGVMFDDVFAGIYAWIVLRVILMLASVV